MSKNNTKKKVVTNTVLLLEIKDDMIKTFMQNPFTTDNEFNNTLFETYGKEYDFVLRHLNMVYTLVEEDGERFITKGLRFANRLGYFIKNTLNE